MKAAVRALQAIFTAGILPCAAELADEFTLAAAAKYTGSKRLGVCKAHLIVELDGQKNSVRSELPAVKRVIRQHKPLFVERGIGDQGQDGEGEGHPSGSRRGKDGPLATGSSAARRRFSRAGGARPPAARARSWC